MSCAKKRQRELTDEIADLTADREGICELDSCGTYLEHCNVKSAVFISTALAADLKSASQKATSIKADIDEHMREIGIYEAGKR
jgi:hypothetical protein